MGYWEDMLESTDEKALFFEVYLEEWPAARELSDEQKHQLYAALTEALAAIQCPSQGMKVIGDQLYIVLELSEFICINDMLETLENTLIAALPDIPAPELYSVYSMCAHEVIDAVVLLHS